jgi:ATP-dependent Clp protease adaptor protein ClpS
MARASVARRMPLAPRYVPPMAHAPGRPGEPLLGSPSDPGRVDPRREGGLATATRRKVARPPKYKVVLYNDDYTPMEFVVAILENLFKKGPTEATQIMLAIHRSGLGVAGVYVQDIAETKVAAVHTAAERQGYPLRAGVEPE